MINISFHIEYVNKNIIYNGESRIYKLTGSLFPALGFIMAVELVWTAEAVWTAEIALFALRLRLRALKKLFLRQVRVL